MEYLTYNASMHTDMGQLAEEAKEYANEEFRKDNDDEREGV